MTLFCCNIVFVYLGDKLPSYLLKNLEYTKKSFPQHNIYFIGDSSATIKRVSQLEISTFLARKLEIIENETYGILNHSMDFRSGFWFKTLSRFFALAEFQRILGEPIFQIEGDVWLATNFPFEKFLGIEAEIAFPMQNANQGAASILWIKDSYSSEKLASIARTTAKVDPGVTDMTLLALIARNNLMSYEILPTIPDPSFQSSLTLDHLKQSMNFQRFGGCFDALPYGMYILGTDPRNNRGISRIFHKQELDYFPNHLSRFMLSNDGNQIAVWNEDKSFALFCLHNHAKIEKLWGSRRERIALFNKRIKKFNSSREPWHKLHIRILLIVLIEAMRRRCLNLPGFKKT